MADQLTLAFDTSAAHCAAALLLGDTLLASRVEEMSKGQAERLMPLLEEILTEAGKSWGGPAPLYLRPADAAPPRDPAPVIL